MDLRARYHEILSYRAEGLRKYGGRLTSDIYGPPFRLAFPALKTREPAIPHVKIGPFHVCDNPPIYPLVRSLASNLGEAVNVLELGPGKGALATVLRADLGARLSSYYGIERDEALTGCYESVTSLSEVAGPIHLIIASEVIEHMSSEKFFGDFMENVRPKLDPSAVVIVGTPNALSPSSIFGDFTHVQGYAWYDLYALLRLFFKSVEVVRTRYMWSAARMTSLLPRIALCKMLELDWCEGIVCIGREVRISE